MASSSSVKFRRKRNTLEPPDRRNMRTVVTKDIASPMTDFLDVKLARVTKREYTRQ